MDGSVSFACPAMYANRETKLETCQQRIGYRFKNTRLLQTALTHSSCATTGSASNERLEFLGDAVLGMVVSDELFNIFPHYREGTLTMIKSSVVSRKTCAQIARGLELGETLFLGGGISVAPDSVLSNAMEAVIAAIYLDAGLDRVRQFILDTFRGEIESCSNRIGGENFKSALQEMVQREHPGSQPDYQLVDEKGPDHKKCFKVQVVVEGRTFQGAWGPTKKAAEQKAAENAYALLGGKSPPWPDC